MNDEHNDFEPPLRILSRAGEPITTVDEWRTRAAPVGGDRAWKPGRSAYELANAWVGGTAPAIPSVLAELLSSATQTAGFVPGLARPEARVALDAFAGNTRNADLLLHGKSGAKRTVVTIEAKADEPFGRYVHQELEGVADKPSSNLPKRISAISELLFGTDADAGALRYQLLHGLAATVLEARRRSADLAVFVVHQFRTSKTVDERISANHDDLRAFMRRLGADGEGLQEVAVAGAPELTVLMGLTSTDTRA